MILSNMPPRTPSRGLRRAFLLQAASGLLAVLLAAPAPALAQGLIQFSVGLSTFTRYQVGDDGTGLRTLPFPETSVNRIYPTTRSDYQGGRQYLYPSNNNLMVWSEVSGQSKAVTSFQAPLSISLGSNLWSNDGLDSFVSFFLYNGATGQFSIYRAHVSAADLASASYLPVTLGDPRLELVLVWPTGNGPFYWWSHDGSRFYYPDPRDKTKIRVKTVGVGLTVDNDPIVFVSPVEVAELRVNPPVNPLNPVSERYLVATAANGILAMDLGTSTSPANWWWLVTWTGINGGPRSPCFSPDGSLIAFANTRYDRKTPYYGVYTVPFFGGSISTVTEVMGSSKISAFPTVNNWDTP